MPLVPAIPVPGPASIFALTWKMFGGCFRLKIWTCMAVQQRAQLSLNWIHRMNRCSTEPHFSNHERNDCFMCAQEALWNNSENWFIYSLSKDSTRQIQLARIVLVDWWPAASSALVQSLVIEGWRMTGETPYLRLPNCKKGELPQSTACSKLLSPRLMAIPWLFLPRPTESRKPHPHGGVQFEHWQPNMA